MKLRSKLTKRKSIKSSGSRNIVNETVVIAKPPLRVLGLDISLRHTGIVVLTEDGAVEYKETFHNKLQKEPLPKLGDYNMVVDYLKWFVIKHFQNKNAPVIIAREDYAYSASSASETLLKELGGIIEWELSKLPILGSKMLWVPVTLAKKFATGKGNAQKSEMMKEVFKRFGFDGDEHASDAFAVAGVVLEARFPGTFPDLTKPQQEAAKAFTLPQWSA
jgi:Holliday junction resolvasome RuvABC endonuclease subunit